MSRDLALLQALMQDENADQQLALQAWKAV